MLLHTSCLGYTLKGELSLHATFTFCSFSLEESPAPVEVDSFESRWSGCFLLRFMLILFLRSTKFSYRIFDFPISLFHSLSICSRCFVMFGEGCRSKGSSIVMFSSLEVLRYAIGGENLVD